LTRFNVLSSLVSSVLITGKSALRQVSLGNGERKQFASKVKQYKRWVMNENVSVKSYYLPYMKKVVCV